MFQTSFESYHWIGVCSIGQGETKKNSNEKICFFGRWQAAVSYLGEFFFFLALADLESYYFISFVDAIIFLNLKKRTYELQSDKYCGFSPCYRVVL